LALVIFEVEAGLFELR